MLSINVLHALETLDGSGTRKDATSLEYVCNAARSLRLL